MCSSPARRRGRLPRAILSALVLAALAGGLALPLATLLVGDEPAAFCCRGRCCCTGERTGDGDGRPCLRAACGCGHTGAVVVVAPLRLEAVLAAVVAKAALPARPHDAGVPPERPIDRPHQPPLPPPRRPLPA